MLLSKVSGKAIVTQDDLSLAMACVGGKTDGAVESTGATVQFWMPISAQLSDLVAPKPPPTKGLAMTATAQQLDSSLPIEDLVSIFAPFQAGTSPSSAPCSSRAAPSTPT